VTGGGSGALIYRIEAASRPYLLRIETAAPAHGNPQRGYTCMRMAADAGIAPALHYTDASTGVVIMDFVEQRALGEFPGGLTGLAHELGQLVRRTHALTTFPQFSDLESMLSRMLEAIAGSGLFSPGLLSPHLEGFQRIRQAYPWREQTPVSSHNDLNPSNVLFDGERLWLIDWELAFRNEPLFDVALVVDSFALPLELADILLRSGLEREPDRGLHARLRLMRLLTRLTYGCIMLMGCIGLHAPTTHLLEVSEVDLQNALTRLQRQQSLQSVCDVGQAFLGMFLSGLRAPGFDEALVCVAQGGA
jgi:hypothetical protein